MHPHTQESTRRPLVMDDESYIHARICVLYSDSMKAKRASCMKKRFMHLTQAKRGDKLNDHLHYDTIVKIGS